MRITTSINLGLSKDVANDIVVQPDGKIVLGGYTRLAANAGRWSMFARFHADGSPDSTFSPLGDGIVWFCNASFSDEAVNAIDIASNGKIVGVGEVAVAGQAGARGLMTRVTTAGIQDSIGSSGEYSAELDGSNDRSTVFNDAVAIAIPVPRTESWRSVPPSSP